MPLYEYECANGHRFELIRKFSDPPADTCPQCGATVRKLMSSPAIQFKGSGWYITDYAKKDSTATPKPDAAKGDGAGGSDAGAKTGDTPAAAPAPAPTTPKAD
jgi:putative FmdB family regulatory protein